MPGSTRPAGHRTKLLSAVVARLDHRRDGSKFASLSMRLGWPCRARLARPYKQALERTLEAQKTPCWCQYKAAWQRAPRLALHPRRDTLVEQHWPRRPPDRFVIDPICSPRLAVDPERPCVPLLAPSPVLVQNHSSAPGPAFSHLLPLARYVADCMRWRKNYAFSLSPLSATRPLSPTSPTSPTNHRAPDLVHPFLQ